MGYEKLLDPLNDLRDSCEVLLGGLFGRLTGDARESVKAIHAGTGGLYALFVDIITALGIENTARRAFLQDKFRKLLRLVIDNSRALLAEMDGPLNEEQQVSVTFIYETGVRLQQYVESIWLYSRLHLNQIKARVEPLALPQLNTALRPPPVERTLQTIFFVDQGLPPVHSDPRLLRRCVQELLDNAAKFSTRDLVIIHCQPAASGPGLRIDVIDTGRGIEPPAAARLFEPFYQVDSSSDGIGLGLTIAGQIARLLGGHLDLTDSRRGTGSTFSLSLPAA